MMRIGLIGVGKHGRRYASHLREDFPDLELAGVARGDRARVSEAARELGCRGFATYREVIEAPEIDALIAVVPPTLHEELVALSARAGKPLLLEKPAAVNLAEGRRMLATVREHGTVVMVAHTLRYNGVVQSLRQRIEETAPLHAVTLTQRFEPSTLDWLDDPVRSGGGIILHTGIHSFDLLRYLTGAEAESVVCRQGRVRTSGTEDNFAASISLAGGRIFATVAGSRATLGRTGYIEVAGEGGSLVGDHVLNRAHLVVGTQAQTIALGDPIPTVRETLRDFAAVLRGDREVPISLEEGLRAVAIADACYRSARTGETAPVEGID